MSLNIYIIIFPVFSQEINDFSRIKYFLFPLDESNVSYYNKDIFGGIAQPVRALASHVRGRRFESYCLHQFKACDHIGYGLFICANEKTHCRSDTAMRFL